jgi:hypothetical protein
MLDEGMVVQLWERVARAAERIADRLDPPPVDVVDSPWVAARLGCTTTWVAELVRRGQVPRDCLVPGTGNGKPWKFYRHEAEAWLASR